MVVVVAGLVGVGAGCWVAKGVLGAWVKDPSAVLAMVAAAAVIDLPGGIAALLPHSSGRRCSSWGNH
jgi:hypothetical protein